MKKVERHNPENLKTRTRRFALEIIRLYATLPKSTEAQVLGKQLLRSGTSVGAHYRESIRGRSNAEVVSKLEVGLQELEETQYWFELLAESGIVQPERLSSLIQEADELTAILVTCVKKVKGRSK
ncbi:four helix bundle protein [Patescibacteria group bacterium]|nr:four helix bundle protein [Patescibacteria group bacterium]